MPTLDFLNYKFGPQKQLRGSISRLHVPWSALHMECKKWRYRCWAEKLDDRIYIFSVLWLIPHFGFSNGADRL